MLDATIKFQLGKIGQKEKIMREKKRTKQNNGKGTAEEREGKYWRLKGNERKDNRRRRSG